MSNNNNEIFVGRLGVDPILKYTKNQIPVCTLSVAINSEGSSKAIWKKVIVWDKQAENCNLYLKKGKKVFVQGQTEEKSYESTNGITKTYQEVKASLVGFTH
tara:strand:- start:161 stop:466 length:306 start_codon:yes stop_codon:yes gene_type:complete